MRSRNRWDDRTQQRPPLWSAGESPPRENQVERTRGTVLSSILALIFLGLTFVAALPSHAFFSSPAKSTLFAIDPDVVIRKMDPAAPGRMWVLGQGWGLPPLFYQTKVPGLYDRWDFLYPLGSKEESYFRTKTRFTPLVDTEWYKIPPYEGYSRYFTAFWGRSDEGEKYWGVFPFYGFSHHKFGADRTFFAMFPLYYESTNDDTRTMRILWPLITYAKSPSRDTFKIWPLYGKEAIGRHYFSRFILWPLFQRIDKNPGTEQQVSYTASPFPLYMRTDTPRSTTIDLCWPFISYYRNWRGHRKYSFRPFFEYGSGGGVDELNIMYFYTSKKDRWRGTEDGSGGGYVAVGEDEVFTEKKFLLVSSIQKRYKKGCLVFAKYKFWPFAEYSWDAQKGSHLKIPELTGFKSDWWDINLGYLLRLVDIRDTPITREISYMFGLSHETKIKQMPTIPCPPKLGDDSWSELIAGSFGKR